MSQLWKFKVGDYVKIVTPRSADEGVIGKIQRKEGNTYKVTNSGWYTALDLKAVTKEEYERAYADSLPVLPGSPLDERLPAPATAPAAGLSAFAQAVQGDDSLAVALYEAAAMTKEAEDMHKRVDELEAQLAATEARLQAADTRIAWAEEILDTVEETAPKDWGGSSDPLPHDWYHAGQLVREYRAEYQKQATQATA